MNRQNAASVVADHQRRLWHIVGIEIAAPCGVSADGHAAEITRAVSDIRRIAGHVNERRHRVGEKQMGVADIQRADLMIARSVDRQRAAVNPRVALVGGLAFQRKGLVAQFRQSHQIGEVVGVGQRREAGVDGEDRVDGFEGGRVVQVAQRVSRPALRAVAGVHGERAAAGDRHAPVVVARQRTRMLRVERAVADRGRAGVTVGRVVERDRTGADLHRAARPRDLPVERGVIPARRIQARPAVQRGRTVPEVPRVVALTGVKAGVVVQHQAPERGGRHLVDVEIRAAADGHHVVLVTAHVGAGLDREAAFLNVDRRRRAARCDGHAGQAHLVLADLGKGVAVHGERRSAVDVTQIPAAVLHAAEGRVARERDDAQRVVLRDAGVVDDRAQVVDARAGDRDRLGVQVHGLPGQRPAQIERAAGFDDRAGVSRAEGRVVRSQHHAALDDSRSGIGVRGGEDQLARAFMGQGSAARDDARECLRHAAAESQRARAQGGRAGVAVVRREQRLAGAVLGEAGGRAVVRHPRVDGQHGCGVVVLQDDVSALRERREESVGGNRADRDGGLARADEERVGAQGLVGAVLEGGDHCRRGGVLAHVKDAVGPRARQRDRAGRAVAVDLRAERRVVGDDRIRPARRDGDGRRAGEMQPVHRVIGHHALSVDRDPRADQSRRLSGDEDPSAVALADAGTRDGERAAAGAGQGREGQRGALPLGRRREGQRAGVAAHGERAGGFAEIRRAAVVLDTQRAAVENNRRSVAQPVAVVGGGRIDQPQRRAVGDRVGRRGGDRAGRAGKRERAVLDSGRTAVRTGARDRPRAAAALAQRDRALVVHDAAAELAGAGGRALQDQGFAAARGAGGAREEQMAAAALLDGAAALKFHQAVAGAARADVEVAAAGVVENDAAAGPQAARGRAAGEGVKRDRGRHVDDRAHRVVVRRVHQRDGSVVRTVPVFKARGAGELGVEGQGLADARAVVEMVVAAAGAQEERPRSVDRAVLGRHDAAAAAVVHGQGRSGAEIDDAIGRVDLNLPDAGVAVQIDRAGGVVGDVEHAGGALQRPFHRDRADAVQVERLGAAAHAADRADGQGPRRMVVAQRIGRIGRVGTQPQRGVERLARAGRAGDADFAAVAQDVGLTGPGADRIGGNRRRVEHDVQNAGESGRVEHRVRAGPGKRGGLPARRIGRRAPVGAVGPEGVLRAVPRAAGGTHPGHGAQRDGQGKRKTLEDTRFFHIDLTGF